MLFFLRHKIVIIFDSIQIFVKIFKIIFCLSNFYTALSATIQPALQQNKIFLAGWIHA